MEASFLLFKISEAISIHIFQNFGPIGIGSKLSQNVGIYNHSLSKLASGGLSDE